MRRLITRFTTVGLALTALLLIVPASAGAQSVLLYDRPVSLSANVSAATGDTPCALIKYVGSTVGKPTGEVAAGGDMTLKIAGAADTTTGNSGGALSSDGVFDLSTPNANIDTMGELVQIVNSQGSNWRMVLVGCLAADLTNNTIDTLSATDASTPKGVALYRDIAVASATAVFSAQAAVLPAGAATDIRYFLSGGPVGNVTGSSKVNSNPMAHLQARISNVRENITSAGVVALFEILGVKRVYSGGASGGNTVTETVRSLWSETGAATTVEKAKDFNAGPILAAPGEMVIVRQRTATDLTAASMGASGFAVPVP